MNWLKADESALTVALDAVAALTAESFPLGEAVRLDVALSGSTTLPLLVVRRDSPRLVILHNGAVDLERSGGQPIFQRSSWWSDIQASQIFVCDPGTVGPEATSLNWLQASPPVWPAHLTTKVIVSLAKSLGAAQPEQRTYFGSSAGGFGALACLAYDVRARAIVNNAQFDWTRWYPHQVRDVLTRRFPGHLAADVRRKWPYRTNVLRHLSRGRVPLQIDFWVNLASQYDRDIQMPIWVDFLKKSPLVAGNSTLHTYFDEESGHNPLSREKTLELLNG